MKAELGKIRQGHSKPNKQTNKKKKQSDINMLHDAKENIIDLLLDFTTIVNEST